MLPMKAVARKLRIAASPLVLAVALGMLAPDVLFDDEADVSSTPSPDGQPDHAPTAPETSERAEG